MEKIILNCSLCKKEVERTKRLNKISCLSCKRIRMQKRNLAHKEDRARKVKAIQDERERNRKK